MNCLRKRLLAIVAVGITAATLSLSLGSNSAQAMSPNQVTVTGTVNKLYWDLDAFWKWALNNANYRSPTIGYYTTMANTVCGPVYDTQVMAHCSYGNGQIWVSSGVNQSKITRLGDYAAGFFLAHEWGHQVAKTLGYWFPTTRGQELYADCMAGVFTRYGYDSRRLDAHDYWEAIWSLDDSLPYEGSPGGYPLKAERKAWYQLGYTAYSLGTCALAVHM